MTLEQSITIMAEVCQSFNGTFNDHQKIQLALKTLTEAAVLNANKAEENQQEDQAEANLE